MKKPLAYYLEPPPLPQEALEPVPDKQVSASQIWKFSRYSLLIEKRVLNCQVLMFTRVFFFSRIIFFVTCFPFISTYVPSSVSPNFYLFSSISSTLWHTYNCFINFPITLNDLSFCQQQVKEEVKAPDTPTSSDQSPRGVAKRGGKTQRNRRRQPRQVASVTNMASVIIDPINSTSTLMNCFFLWLFCFKFL